MTLKWRASSDAVHNVVKAKPKREPKAKKIPKKQFPAIVAALRAHFGK